MPGSRSSRRSSASRCWRARTRGPRSTGSARGTAPVHVTNEAVVRQARLRRTGRGAARGRPDPVDGARCARPSARRRWSSSSRASRSRATSARCCAARTAPASTRSSPRRRGPTCSTRTRSGPAPARSSRVPLAAAPTAEVLAWLRAAGMRIVAARVDAERLYTEADLTGPLALVLGAEADGLTDAWVGDDIEAVRLPMLGVADSLNVSVSAAILAYEARRQRGLPRRTTNEVTMDTFDFVIIGAGPAGEAAAYKARELGATVAVDRPAVVRRQLPAHRLPALEVAARRRRPPRREPRRATTGRTLGARATTWSTGRRMPPSPTIRATCAGCARRARSPTAATRDDRRARAGSRSATTTRRTSWPPRTWSSRSGRSRSVPPIEGLDAIPIWTNREATLARELPASLLVLGGGPTGCELAQVYARFGVPTTIVQSGPRLAPTDHPRNSEVVRAALERDGVDGPDRRPRAARPGRRPSPTARTSSSSTTARPPRATRSCSPSAGRSRSTTSGSSTTASTRAAGRRSRATAGCASPTGCGSSATRPAPSSTPTRATTRASSPSGWRWARRSCPTTGPCPARPTPTPRRRRSG